MTTHPDLRIFGITRNDVSADSCRFGVSKEMSCVAGDASVVTGRSLRCGLHFLVPERPEIVYRKVYPVASLAALFERGPPGAVSSYGLFSALDSSSLARRRYKHAQCVSKSCIS